LVDYNGFRFYHCNLMENIKKSVLVFTLVAISQMVFAWGQTGHRVVGYVAQQHLTKKASKTINKILTSYSLEMSGNYLDFIKADSNYRFMSSWHYVSIPNGKRYEDITPNAGGDVIAKIEELIKELETKNFKTVKDEEFALMALVHLVADLHQPLHVGLAEDRGGNSIKVTWFYEESNLHRVWDSDMIDHQQLSYTEFGNHISRNITKQMVKAWQGSGVRDWANESQDLRAACYETGDDNVLKYDYIYEHIATVETRLVQAGVRLAGLLNKIYG
jgi:hypothetical protein